LFSAHLYPLVFFSFLLTILFLPTRAPIYLSSPQTQTLLCLFIFFILFSNYTLDSTLAARTLSSSQLYTYPSYISFFFFHPCSFLLFLRDNTLFSFPLPPPWLTCFHFFYLPPPLGYAAGRLMLPRTSGLLLDNHPPFTGLEWSR